MAALDANRASPPANAAPALDNMDVPAQQAALFVPNNAAAAAFSSLLESQNAHLKEPGYLYSDCIQPVMNDIQGLEYLNATGKQVAMTLMAEKSLV